jgi:hypothetical protein
MKSDEYNEIVAYYIACGVVIAMAGNAFMLREAIELHNCNHHLGSNSCEIRNNNLLHVEVASITGVSGTITPSPSPSPSVDNT